MQRVVVPQPMAFLSFSFAVGLLVVLYLLSFVLFAVIRIATGVSIQRIGYLSLRRIAYAPKDGIRIEIRGLGLAFHRPTFARPTWLSLRFTDLKVTVDPTFSASPTAGVPEEANEERSSKDGSESDQESSEEQSSPLSGATASEPARSQTWKQLTQLKERIKALHGNMRWLRMVDLEVLNWSFVITDVATLQLGSLTVAVDTRRRTVDRGRLFRHKKVEPSDQRPAEWIFVLKGVLFTAEGRDSLEVLDICSLNVHGFLVKDKAGLRDVSISLKLGRVHIPYDDVVQCITKTRAARKRFASSATSGHKRGISFTDLMEELDVPGSREEQIVQTLSDSREFISSLLRGIQEIQLAVSFIGLTKRVDSLRPSGQPMFVHSAMNEFGIDLFRLDPKSPAHRMYFSRNDIAHQALLAAISISVSIDDGESKPERILYLPMATTTIKTTLPSKTVSVMNSADDSDRNTNVLFANCVVTSPSVDVDLKHMPIVLALLRQRDEEVRMQSVKRERQHLISRLWPKASVKFSVQEPVARVVLPKQSRSNEDKDDDDFDLLITSISSISLDLESSHSSSANVQYAFTTNFRVASQQLFYQSAAGERHVLLDNDALELRAQVTATNELSVVMSANVETLSLNLVRPEISKGLRQIMKQLNHLPHSRRKTRVPEDSQFIVRRLPRWLTLAQFHGTNFAFEVAGVDSGISPDTRGLAFQLESWSIDYKHQRNATFTKHRHLHRSLSTSVSGDAIPPVSARRARKQGSDPTNGRKLQIQVQNIQGFVVEGIDKWEGHPFLSLPKCDVTMSTSSDSNGPYANIEVRSNAILLQYSLYRYFAFGVARNVVRRAFAMDANSTTKPSTEILESPTSPVDAGRGRDAINLDIKLDFAQIKAQLPSDPSMLLQVYGCEFGRRQWSTTPFFRANIIRLCASAPYLKSAWARVLSIKNLRADLRVSRRIVGKRQINEKLIDVSTELARIAVPHQLVIHKIIDNFVNAFKATEQLQHRFDHGNDEYVLLKGPEGPKHVPKVSFRTRTLMIELEDSPFEWRIGLIYRIGLNEQKQRLAREEAFRLKLKRMEEQGRGREVSQSRPLGRSQTRKSKRHVSSDGSRARPGSTFDSRTARRSSSQSDVRGRQMRYNAESGDGLTNTAKVSRNDAELKLHEHNAASWRQRITDAIKYHHKATTGIRSMFFGNEETPYNGHDNETIIAMPGRPGLMSTIISDFHVTVDKPSFSPEELPKFLHSVGKGMPPDMQYSLLIPMSLQVNMGEARVSLRNYPLPLLHIPALKSGQSTRLPSWSLKTDFVVAEEYRDEESLRQVVVEVIPGTKFFDPPDSKKGFYVDVRRTVSPVKTFSDVDVSINTSEATSITWGTSYQPAIQDMMQVIENFTKPQLDPSERVGFWDKIRLIFHSRIRVNWRGDGDVHFKLKGSRDPYLVTGHGAGFVMCFRQNVRWDIHQEDDPKKFMTVDCGEYVLAIPDYSSQAREVGRGGEGSEHASSHLSQRNNAQFQKVIMKLSGDVRWLAGLVFEQELSSGARSFDFEPHYNISLRTPKYVKAPEGQVYDAFRGFRSHHIHLSLAVIAPVDRDWSVTNSTPSSSYNSIHLSPRFFTHFFDWWSLFSGVMALPIRQGKLFPGIEKSNKKFGRHLATIKYNILLSPLFIAHIYKHKDKEDYAEDTVGATGLKIRIDSFMLDVHQRREEFTSATKESIKQVKTSGMRINRAQLDFITADMRAVSATIAGTSLKDLERASDADIASFQYQNSATPDLSRFEIPDNDFLWIDMDDFVEMDWILPAETHPEVKIMPLAFAPRFTYFRQTDHDGVIGGDPGRSSHFGDEPTHICIMTQENDPHRVQFDLVRGRLRTLEDQLQMQRASVHEAETKPSDTGKADVQRSEELASLKEQVKATEERKHFMLSMLKSLSTDNYTSREEMGQDFESSKPLPEDAAPPDWNEQPDFETAISDFNNRFIVHNVQLKWNNGLRNIILRYVHQVSQRRGFVYYMSRRAVKFILDILQERDKKKPKMADLRRESSSGQSSPNVQSPDYKEPSLQDRITDLLNDGRTFVDANDPHSSKPPTKFRSDDLQDDVAEDFVAQNSYHVRLIAPQIQLQSEKNSKSALLLTGKEMELKVVQIMDRERLSDDVSGLVQRRFSLEIDGLQFFVTNSKTFQNFVHLYSANRYGAPKDSVWPPWLPLEVNFNFHVNPIGWFRVVQKTSASLRYDKYNNLRLKYHDEVSKGEKDHAAASDDSESRLDHLWVDFPHVRAICDSTQYYTIYVIVLDLLLYSEPLEKSRTERLEKIMLAADFSDLTGAPEMVVSLQDRIRQLEEIKTYFQVHEKYLDRQGWHDRLAIESDLITCEDELFFIMKAITTSQQKVDDRAQKQTNGLLRWYLSASEIVWRLMRKEDEPLVEIQLQKAAYDRTDNSDGSNHNTMEIERIKGLNLLPDALYPEMISPYYGNSQLPTAEIKAMKMFKVQWHMLEAIAGIPVLDQFEVNLFPLKLQLERETGKKLFEYIFPGNAASHRASPFVITGMVPLQEDSASDNEQKQSSVPSINTPQSDSQASTRPGSIDIRLRPTLTLEHAPPSPSSSHKLRVSQAPSIASSRSRGRFSGGSTSASETSIVSMQGVPREPLRSDSYLVRRRSQESTRTAVSHSADRAKRYGRHKQPSKEDAFTKQSAEIAEMMSRASNYMTLAYVKIPSVVLCLSYKGRGERSLSDVHDFVFRMPALEYRNKTWSNLDLALRLKRDVIKALISHTGAIIGNKISNHRPSKLQQTKLRELANSSSLLPNTNNLPNTLSRTMTALHGGSTHETANSSDKASLGYDGARPLTASDAQSSSKDFATPDTEDSVSFASDRVESPIAELDSDSGDEDFKRNVDGDRAENGTADDASQNTHEKSTKKSLRQKLRQSFK